MGNLTPMMAQYKQIKEKYQDCILMFRLGDFFEMFFDDAIVASKILQITLTARNKESDMYVPMCGVPFHAIDNYIYKLTSVGKKVALCDQLTQPDGKTLVKRDVIRVITPGTTFDENILDSKSNNFVASIVFEKNIFAIAYCDITTGEAKTTICLNLKDLETELSRLSVRECILENDLLSKLTKLFERNKNIFAFPFSYNKNPTEEILNIFGINSLKSFGLEDYPQAIKASGMLLEYLKETQKTEIKNIQKICFYEASEFMPLDLSTIRNLDLFYTKFDNKKEGSLIFAIDQTITSMGGRKLRNWLTHPLIKKEQIDERLNKVEAFFNNSSLIRDVRENLKNIFDIERLSSRLALGTGNARDLLALKKSLQVIPEIKNLIKNNSVFNEIDENLNTLNELVSLIESAIIDMPPITVREGGMIKDGYNVELDGLKNLSREGKTFLKNIQEREIKRTGISSLKVKFNSVFGYYIEISKAKQGNIPSDYIRKQTLVNAERFITPELKEYEEKVLTAESRIKDIEYEIFYGVRMAAVKEIIKLQKIAMGISEIDVISSFAYLAEKKSYAKPVILENDEMEIIDGRHPVIENISLSRKFVPNDCKFSEEKNFLLITGPNMGGKSTYLRQIALINLMAQIGMFVPAKSAKISIIDRIFTRVGASDNLVSGESTFMVEMTEAAYILNHATKKSLIILDEIGRGTSTYDGVSIAWAIMEFIHDKVGAKTIFATHYHELIELADKLEKARNFSVTVRENEKEGVVFLYKIVEGGVDKSYGIEVAKLAGLPVDVVSRARGALTELENKHIQKTRVHKDQIELVEDREHSKINQKNQEVLSELKDLDVNNMTPVEAIQKLSEIKKRTLF